MSTVTRPTRAQTVDGMHTLAPLIRWVPRAIVLAWAAWSFFFASTLMWETRTSYMAEEFGYTPAWYYVAAAAGYIAVVGAIVALFWQLGGGVILAVSAIVAAVASIAFYPEVNRQLGTPNASTFDVFGTLVPLAIAALLVGGALLLRRRSRVTP